MLVTLITFQIDIKDCFGLSKVSNIINESITTLVYSFSKSDLKDLLLAFDYFLSNEMLPYTTRPPPSPVTLRIVYQRNLCRSWKSGPEQRREKNKNKLNRICWKCWNPAEVDSQFFLLFPLIERKKKPSAKKWNNFMFYCDNEWQKIDTICFKKTFIQKCGSSISRQYIIQL